jgi:hypothetical protein
MRARINIEAAAALLGCSRRSVYNYIERGLLEHQRDERGAFVTMASVELAEAWRNRPRLTRPRSRDHENQLARERYHRRRARQTAAPVADSTRPEGQMTA